MAAAPEPAPVPVEEAAPVPVAADHEEVKEVRVDEPAKPEGELKPDLEPVETPEQEVGVPEEQEEEVVEEEEPELVDGGERVKQYLAGDVQ